MFSKLEERSREFFCTILFSTSDLSIILVVVYMLNFLLTGKCTLTTYHYYIGLDSVLLACSTMLLTFFTAQQHYWHTLAGPLRFIASLAIFILLGILFGYQTFTHGDKAFPEWNPPDIQTRNDSALILPVSCFFDPDLIMHENPYAAKRKAKLSLTQIARIGKPIKNYQVPELWLYIFLTLLFVLSSLTHLCTWLRARPQNADRQTKGITLFTLVVVLLCLATDMFCAWHITRLRAWARLSGWLRDGREDEVFSLGQLMPLFALVSVVFMMMSRVSIRAVREGFTQLRIKQRLVKILRYLRMYLLG